MASNQTAHSSCHNQTLEPNGSSFRTYCLVKEGKDGDTGGSTEKLIQFLDAEEHGEGEKPRCDEADSNGSHDCNWYHLFGMSNLFGHVRGTVEAGEGPVGVYESHNESFTVEMLREFGSIWFQAGI